MNGEDAKDAGGGTHAVRAVAVIGASRYLGAHLVGALLRESSIEKVVAIDSKKPSAQFRRRMGDAEFVRVDPQSPRMQGILREAGVDTVVHVALDNNDFAPGGRAAVKESNIMGSMHVMAAVGRADDVKRFVLLSSTTVYGSSGMDPAKFSEDMAAKRSPGGGVPRDYLSVEGYARGLNRKRPDIEVTILRIPAILGLPEPTVFGELLQPSLSPVLAGYDPRLQLLHPHDALEALVLATMRGPGGTFNVAGEGMVTLSQAIRRAGHVPVPVIPPLFRLAAGIFTGEGLKRIGSSQLQYLRHGRGVDTRRMREVFDFTPRYTTNEALAAYIKDAGIEPLVSAASARAAVRALVVGLPRALHPAILESVDHVLANLAAEGAAEPVPALAPGTPAQASTPRAGAAAAATTRGASARLAPGEAAIASVQRGATARKPAASAPAVSRAGGAAKAATAPKASTRSSATSTGGKSAAATSASGKPTARSTSAPAKAAGAKKAAPSRTAGARPAGSAPERRRAASTTSTREA